MRIIQVTFGLSAGGAERLVVDLSNELVNNHEVTVLTLKDDKINNNDFYLPELSKKINYVNVGIKEKFSIKDLFVTYKTIKSIRPDIVHIHLGWWFIILSILFYRNPKYIETIHSRADKIVNNWLFYIIKYLIFKFRLVHACAISEENRRSIQQTFRIKNPYLVYNGVKSPLKTSKFDDVQKEINELKTSQEDLVFLHIGRFCKAKNQEMLISCFNHLCEFGYKFVLLIIGDGFQKNLGKELKLKANAKIHFLGVRNNIADYLLNADAFCLSSLYEGMPISLIESFACGCIPICTPTSGSIDLIKHGENGFLSKDFTKDEYIKAIQNFLKHFSEINIEELKMLYSDKFTISKCAQKYLTIYSK